MGTTPLPKLTDAEFEIMEIVWEAGETTINHVWETINRKRQTRLSRTTIQVQMNRLEEKQWLRHTQRGRTFLYSPTRQKSETLESLLGDMHERYFNGSGSDLVKCLFKSVQLTKEEIGKLKQMILDREGDF